MIFNKIFNVILLFSFPVHTFIGLRKQQKQMLLAILATRCLPNHHIVIDRVS